MALAEGLAWLKTAADLSIALRKSIGDGTVTPEQVPAGIIALQGYISDGRAAFIEHQQELLDKPSVPTSMRQNPRP